MQKHWDVMRSENAGDSWNEVSGNLPSDFGFPIDVHAHEPDTIYVVPIKSDSEHFPPDGKLRVYRSRSGGNEWEALTKGLPQSDCYVNVLRDAMCVDSLDKCGVYFGTTGGQVYGSADAGDTLETDRPRPSRRSLRRSPDAENIPVPKPNPRQIPIIQCPNATPADLAFALRFGIYLDLGFDYWDFRTIRVAPVPSSEAAESTARCSSTLRAGHPASSSTPSRRAIRCCAEQSAITSRKNAVPSCDSSPANKTSLTTHPTLPSPMPSRRAQKPSSSLARWREDESAGELVIG